MTRSLSQIKEDARNALAGNYMLYFVVLVITGFLTMLFDQFLTYLPIPVNNMPVAFLLVINLVLSFILTVLSKMFQAGQYFLSLNISRYNRVSVSDLFLAFRYDTKKAFQLSAILSLVSTLCTMPFLFAFWHLLYNGYLDFLYAKTIPVQTILLYLLGGFAGMIVMEVAFAFPFSQALFLYIDHQEYSVSECVSKSFECMSGHRMEYLKLHLSLAGYFALCILSMGLGVFWVVPYMNVSRAGFYMSITGTYKPY